MKKNSQVTLKLSPQAKAKEEEANLHHLWRKKNQLARLLRKIQIWVFLFVGCLVAAFIVTSAKAGSWQHLRFFVGAGNTSVSLSELPSPESSVLLLQLLHTGSIGRTGSAAIH